MSKYQSILPSQVSRRDVSSSKSKVVLWLVVVVVLVLLTTARFMNDYSEFMTSDTIAPTATPSSHPSLKPSTLAIPSSYPSLKPSTQKPVHKTWSPTKSPSNVPTYSPTPYATINFTLVNENYNPVKYFEPGYDEWKHYNILEGYVGIIEPHNDMNLYIYEDSKYVAPDAVHVLKIYLNEAKTFFVEARYKYFEPYASVNIACTPYQTFDAELHIWLNKVLIQKQYVQLICMYVRREFNALSNTSVSKLMDAMHAVWATSEDTGQERYGSSFHSSTFFAKAYAFNVAQFDTDHIHEGSGFLFQYNKLINCFEASLQAVNPAVSLPYWDFTIESSKNISLRNSIMFSNFTFGSLTMPNGEYWSQATNNASDARIADGRWQDLLVDVNLWYLDMAQRM
jgi:hypothetical protein